jgi:energy-coupling factor transporter transmembrane protein EcfT
MIVPTILIISNVRHIKEEKNRLVKQKFEILSICLSFVLNVIFLLIGFFFLFLAYILIKAPISEIFKLDKLILILFGFISLFFAFIFIKSTVYFFRHIYIESFRDIYFDRETKTLIENKKSTKIQIKLNSENLKVISYITYFKGNITSFGKTEIIDITNTIVISDALDLTPEFVEIIANCKEKMTIEKKFVWI